MEACACVRVWAWACVGTCVRARVWACACVLAEGDGTGFLSRHVGLAPLGESQTRSRPFFHKVAQLLPWALKL